MSFLALISSQDLSDMSVLFRRRLLGHERKDKLESDTGKGVPKKVVQRSLQLINMEIRVHRVSFHINMDFGPFSAPA